MQAGRGTRLFVRDLRGGRPRAITGEGVSAASLALSRDGATAAALDARRRPTLYPVGGGAPVTLAGLEADEVPLGFADDGSLFVGKTRALSVPVFRYDVRTHRRALVRTLEADAPGALGVFRVLVTPDAKTFAFNYASVTTHLYLMTREQ